MMSRTRQLADNTVSDEDLFDFWQRGHLMHQRG